jgi:hypothetical protein
MIGARNARPDPVTRRHPDDAGDRRGGKAAWHSRARPQHRRQGRARELSGAEADLGTSAFENRTDLSADTAVQRSKIKQVVVP